jgi:hypothetical protein
MHLEAYNGLATMLNESGLDLNRAWSALDLGGRNINGSIRDLIPGAYWEGLDIVDGPGVDIVRDATLDWPSYMNRYDIIVTTELLEHVEDWRGVIRTAAQILRCDDERVWDKEEIIFITCASTGRRPHGASGELDPPPGEWYGNIAPDEMERQLDKFFTHYQVTYNPMPGDVYAWAQCVKRK